MTINNILIVIFTLLSFSLFAQKNVETTFEVDGVCGMCEKRIEKASLTTRGVRFADWNVETRELTLIYNPKKTSVEQVKKNIAAAGHDSDTCKATDEVYDNLHACCKYREDEKE